MPDQDTKIIKNSLSSRCMRCTGIHDYITKLSNDAPCDTPLGFSDDYAKLVVARYKMDDEDIISAPDDTVVILHESARKLQPQSQGTTQLAQFDLSETLM